VGEWVARGHARNIASGREARTHGASTPCTGRGSEGALLARRADRGRFGRRRRSRSTERAVWAQCRHSAEAAGQHPPVPSERERVGRERSGQRSETSTRSETDTRVGRLVKGGARARGPRALLSSAGAPAGPPVSNPFGGPAYTDAGRARPRAARPLHTCFARASGTWGSPVVTPARQLDPRLLVRAQTRRLRVHCRQRRRRRWLGEVEAAAQPAQAGRPRLPVRGLLPDDGDAAPRARRPSLRKKLKS
jgi:hypothetical protein